MHLVRGDEVESSHRVHGVVAGLEDGEARCGEPEMLAYWRSSAKPVQALPVVSEGAAERFGLDGQDLALCCASHAGTPRHVRGVRRLLRKADLEPSALACGPHRPFQDEAARALDRSGEEYAPIHNNCSGKHAGMLARAAHAGDPTDGYLEHHHPVQRRYRRSLARWLDVDPDRLGWAIDGCGVPTPYLSLRQMARAYARLARAARDGEEAPAAVVEAMIEHPELVAGEGRLTTRLLRRGDGTLLAKEGAEGVLCLAGLDQGWGLALKVLDGSKRAMGPAAAGLLRELELLAPEARERVGRERRRPVRNTLGEEVGRLQAEVSVRSGPVAGRV